MTFPSTVVENSSRPDASAGVLDHPDLRIEDGALIFPMPVAAYDCLMDHEMLPHGACYNSQRETLEVEPVPNGRYHDPRAAAVSFLFHDIATMTTVPVHAATTQPVEGRDRRHPDASLIVDRAKIRQVAAGTRPAPVPDVVVEIDYTPLSEKRERERFDAYARLGVPEVWTWRRTGGADSAPQGRTTFHALRGDGHVDADESAAVPGMRPTDMDALMHEADDLRRDRMAHALAQRLAPRLGDSPLLA